MAGRPRTHRWVDDACRRCGLRRRETWLLDRQRRPVMALVWSKDTGDIRIQPFPPMKGLHPPVPPARTLEQAFAHLPVGPEPACERPPDPDPEVLPEAEADRSGS